MRLAWQSVCTLSPISSVPSSGPTVSDHLKVLLRKQFLLPSSANLRICANIAKGFYWLFYFGITKATPSLLHSMNQWGTFLFFVGWCMIALVYSYISVPETAGRALENMDELFEQPWYKMRRTARTTDISKQDMEAAEEKSETCEIEYTETKP